MHVVTRLRTDLHGDSWRCIHACILLRRLIKRHKFAVRSVYDRWHPLIQQLGLWAGILMRDKLHLLRSCCARCEFICKYVVCVRVSGVEDLCIIDVTGFGHSAGFNIIEAMLYR